MVSKTGSSSHFGNSSCTSPAELRNRRVLAQNCKSQVASGRFVVRILGIRLLPRRPKTPQDGPRCLKTPPRCPKKPPRCPKKPPRCPQDAPRRPQRCPQHAPRCPKCLRDASRCPKDPQNDTKMPQDAPRCPQDAPRCPQDAPRRPPRHLKEAPKMPQDIPQDPPRYIKMPPKMPPRCLTTKKTSIDEIQNGPRWSRRLPDRTAAPHEKKEGAGGSGVSLSILDVIFVVGTTSKHDVSLRNLMFYAVKCPPSRSVKKRNTIVKKLRTGFPELL